MTTRLAQSSWVLAFIVLAALALRVWAINFGLPYTYAPDETWHMSVWLRMIKEGNLNPHWGVYPHLYFYLNALLFGALYLGGHLLGVFASPADLPYGESFAVGVGKLDMPFEFLLSRGFTALVGAACVVLVYLLGRKISRNRAVGLIAAALFAVSPTGVANSHIMRPDTLALFFTLVALLWIERAVTAPRMGTYVLAGVGIGLAFASKYNAVVVAAALVVAHWLNYGWGGFRRKEIYVAALVAVLTFVAIDPYLVFDPSAFGAGLAMAYSSQTSHAGTEGNTVYWYASYLWETEGILVVLGLAQIVRSLIAREGRVIVLMSFAVVYYVFINLFPVRNDRTLLLVIPCIDLGAALLITDAARQFERVMRLSPRMAIAAPVLATGLVLAWPTYVTVQANQRLLMTDSRETARIWIDENVAPGARIAIESYTPYVDPDRFVVEGFESIIAHPPDWYVQNGFEYIVLSYGTYGRFYEMPDRFPQFVQAYEAFFNRFEQVAHFDDAGYEMRVFKTGVTGLPAQRSEARFGVYGPWLELVGYDWIAPELALYWRVLAPRREGFASTARVLGPDDGAIAQTTSTLLSPDEAGARQQQGVFVERITLPVPVERVPGMFKVELDVDAVGVGRIPLLSRHSENVSDKLFIGPLKFPAGSPAGADWQAASPVGAQFGDGIQLTRVAVSNLVLHPGETVRLVLYWTSTGRTDKDYTVFVHLADAGGKVRAQFDAKPRGGQYPTTVWTPGESVPDRYAIELPQDLPPGEYMLVAGLYEYPSLVRLAVSVDGKNYGDSVSLGKVAVR